MIGIAFTGSGKTLAFCLPIIMFALEDEVKLPLIRGEGPVGVILCPSRELATQTYENVLTWTDALSKDGKYPRLNTLLCIGGISMSEQGHVFNKGIHIVVATPGRLIDMLEKKRFTFDNCKYLCMDEADRMIDLGFEDDVRNIMSFFKVIIMFISSNRDRYSCRPIAPTTNTSLLRDDASEDPRLRAAVARQACVGQRWTCWCSEFGRITSSRIRQARSKDGLLARVLAEDPTAGYCFQRE